MRLRALLLSLAVASPAGAVDLGGGPDLGPARAAIAAEDWEGAVAILRPLAPEGGSADALNLLAFATRNLARLTDLCGACKERETLAAALAGEDRGGYRPRE